ncbi:MAG: amidohydrolase [Gemmatimonadetes bacterium]|nr:amidohydrolase [Gemmatimonadota bacterium]
MTVDDRFSIAEAVAARQGRVLAVGETSDVRATAGPGARVVDLGGRTVTPGFIDTHGHIGLFGLMTLWVSLTGARSIAEIRQRIVERVKATPKGDWVVTTPVGDEPYFFEVPNVLAERRFPNRWDLDPISPDNPVYITAPTNRVPNTAILNSRALALAGIERSTAADLEGVEVVKDDKTGEPTGELRGMQPIYNPSPFFARLSALLPPLTYEQRRAGIGNLAPRFAAGGTTALLENHLTSPEELRVYAELLEEGQLPVRVFFTFDIDPRRPLDEIEEFLRTVSFAGGRGFGTSRLRATGVSLGLDGPHWHGTAVAAEPYEGPYGKPVNPGPLVDRSLYAEILKRAARHGLRVHAEAAGRGAIAIALGAMAAVDQEVARIGDCRWVLEHCEFPTKKQILECKRLGVVPTTATNFIWGKGEEVFLQRLGREYAEQAIPLRSWLDAGVPVCQSTDWGPREAMFTIWQSLARKAGLTGATVGAREKISREEALRIFTRNPAYALFMEDELGSIEPGKLADLVVLDGDLVDCPQDDIREMAVAATIVDGEVVAGAL